MPEEGEPTEESLERSIFHLQNAYAIQPDSVQSVDVLSEVYYMLGDLDNAITTMEQAIEVAPVPEAFRLVRLSLFQSENGRP